MENLRLKYSEEQDELKDQQERMERQLASIRKVLVSVQRNTN